MQQQPALTYSITVLIHGGVVSVLTHFKAPLTAHGIPSSTGWNHSAHDAIIWKWRRSIPFFVLSVWVCVPFTSVLLFAHPLQKKIVDFSPLLTQSEQKWEKPARYHVMISRTVEIQYIWYVVGWHSSVLFFVSFSSLFVATFHSYKMWYIQASESYTFCVSVCVLLEQFATFFNIAFSVYLFFCARITLHPSIRHLTCVFGMVFGVRSSYAGCL